MNAVPRWEHVHAERRAAALAPGVVATQTVRIVGTAEAAVPEQAHVGPRLGAARAGAGQAVAQALFDLKLVQEQEAANLEQRWGIEAAGVDVRLCDARLGEALRLRRRRDTRAGC